MEVNNSVVNGFNQFDLSQSQSRIAPKYAASACLSGALIALWTNRVPQHEPWPRTLKIDDSSVQNIKNDDYKKNVGHKDQYDNTTRPAGRQPIGMVEGDEDITRNDLWRR